MSPRRASALRLTFAAILTALLSFTLVSPASAAPPGIPSESTARSMLDGLTVRAEGSMSGYSRDKFPHWNTVEGTCNTREMVLRRDGTDVEVGADCYPTAGSWYSPFDGVTTSVPSEISIDHVVPLAAAWRSGASSWSAAKREEFANDLTNPQLIAVTGRVNSSKGDQTPDKWVPPRTDYHCTYGKIWIASKDAYDLSVTSAEKEALTGLLDTC
ncbi:HNH endonuclease family protein [Actinoalloteichus caeruleus]|uniref:HNH endonuclease family protein n=1 Tax=Actinoalloteichus cyanogriseus TaxID=2893586 RepID=UPI003AAFD14E